MISCENHWCIYQKENFCMFEEINLDEMGLCRDCIYITVPDEIEEKLKIEALEAFRIRDEGL